MSIRVQVDPQQIETICHKWDIKEMSMFGSVLRDDFGPDSDVDILVELEPDHSLNHSATRALYGTRRTP